MEETNAFLSGASTVASGAIAVFFLRFWRRSHDRLFLIFALAFAVFATNRVIIAVVGDDEDASYVYLLRLAAFVLILVAIIDKNRRDDAAPG